MSADILKATRSLRSRGGAALPLLLFFILGTGASVMAYNTATNLEQLRLVTKFNRAADDRIALVRRSVEMNLLVLDTMHAVHISSGGFAQVQFEKFVQPYFDHLDAARGLEWVPRVSRDDRAGYEADMRSVGFTDFEIRELNSEGKLVLAKIRDEYYPVSDPQRRQLRRSSVGFDLASEPIRRAGIEAARDSGETRATGPVRLIGEMEDDLGYLMFIPIYAGGEHAQIADRRKNLQGMITGIFRLPELIEDALSNLGAQGIDIFVFDTTDGTRDFLHYHPWRIQNEVVSVANAMEILANAPLVHTGAVSMAGRSWSIICAVTPEFLANNKRVYPLIILLGGLLLTCAIVGYARVTIKRTLAIAEANAHLEREIVEKERAEKELAAERDKLEEEVELRTQHLSQSLDRVEEANRSKTRFLSSMSHELRTPLNAVLGFCGLLNEPFYGELNEKHKEYVANIDQSGKHLLALIEDLLDMAKIDAGMEDMEWENVNVKEILDATTTMMAPKFQEKSIEVHTTIAPPIVTVRADRRRLSQILLNLLSNATKYSPTTGRIDITVTLPEPSAVKFEVRDSGIGIPMEHHALIFSEFGQVDRARDEALGGIGLGLTLTRRLVELQGGEIGLESKVGEGSTFWFTLPVRETMSIHIPHTQASTSSDEKPLPIAPRGIVVAEDNQTNLDLIVALLEIQNHQVHVARNGKEAVELTASTKPDLVLMDIRMPVMNGLDATRAIRKLPGCEHTPIIALTANADDEQIAECLAAGCNYHLAKPIDRARFWELLRSALATDADKPVSGSQ